MVRPLVHRNTKNEVDYINYDDVIFYPERTCKVRPSRSLRGIVVCECKNSFPDYYEYCPYCGAKVVE